MNNYLIHGARGDVRQGAVAGDRGRTRMTRVSLRSVCENSKRFTDIKSRLPAHTRRKIPKLLCVRAELNPGCETASFSVPSVANILSPLHVQVRYRVWTWRTCSSILLSIGRDHSFYIILPVARITRSDWLSSAIQKKLVWRHYQSSKNAIIAESVF